MKQKLKTKKSVSKRIKITKNGKVLFRGSHIRHLLRKKTKSQVRVQRVLKQMTGEKAKKIKRLMGR
jgi:ribosomal protein L35